MHGVTAVGSAVLVAMTWKVDGAEGERTVANVFHLVDGKVARIRVFLDERGARASA